MRPFTVPAPRGLPSAVDVPAPAGPRPAATRTFARRAEEVPVARRFIRDILAGHPASLDAELLTCELVTNAVQHATDAAGVTVAVMRCGSAVHVDVIDDGRIGLPHWREADGQDEGGRGFQLVNEIAERWGFLREPAGTCVWFETQSPRSEASELKLAGPAGRGRIGSRLMPATCVFCAIIRGEQKAEAILETERLIAFLDHRPLFRGHTLLVPKQHVVLLSDLPADQVPEFFGTAQRLERGSRTAWAPTAR